MSVLVSVIPDRAIEYPKLMHSGDAVLFVSKIPVEGDEDQEKKFNYIGFVLVGNKAYETGAVYEDLDPLKLNDYKETIELKNG